MIVIEDKTGIITLKMTIDESIALQDILKHHKSQYSKELYQVLAKKDRRTK